MMKGKKDEEVDRLQVLFLRKTLKIILNTPSNHTALYQTRCYTYTYSHQFPFVYFSFQFSNSSMSHYMSVSFGCSHLFREYILVLLYLTGSFDLCHVHNLIFNEKRMRFAAFTFFTSQNSNYVSQSNKMSKNIDV